MEYKERLEKLKEKSFKEVTVIWTDINDDKHTKVFKQKPDEPAGKADELANKFIKKLRQNRTVKNWELK